MGWHQKFTLMGCLGLIFISLNLGIVQGSTGNFITPSNRDYYPETILSVELTNLTLNSYYGLLVGANQGLDDKQWDNFTARSELMTREIIHFQSQTYLTNQSQEIQYLLVELYDIDNNSHVNPTRLDLMTDDLVHISDQLNPYVL